MSDESTAVIDRPGTSLETLAAEPRVIRKGKKRKQDADESAVKLDTPFGKLDIELERRIGIPCIIPERPQNCVIDGSAAILANLKEREHLLIKP